VTSVVRASDRSFQVKWTETEYERGSLVGSSRWTAILSVVVKPPRSAETLRENPLGLYVDAIDWSREFEGPPAAPPPAKAEAVQPHQRPDASLPLGSPLDPTLGRAPAPSAPSERTTR
jgi:type IV secretion system protein VirB5